MHVSRPILQATRQAIRDFDLIEPGDRVAIGMSGGKDSALLYAALEHLSRAGDFDFTITPIHLDQRQPGFDHDTMRAQMEMLHTSYEVLEHDTHSIVQEKLKPGQIPCAICGRLRRGILNQHCDARGYTKLALGHHLDDAIETFFLNLLYGRRLEPLKPKTPASRNQVVTIRPLILVEERKVAAWAVAQDVPVVACPVCDTVPESRRRDLKEMMRAFRTLQPDLHASVRAALYSGPQAREAQGS